MTMKRCLTWAAILAASVLSAPVGAQESADFGIDRYAPGMDRDAVVNVESAAVPYHLAYDAGLALAYGHNPLLLRNTSSGDRAGDLVGRRLTLHAFGALALHNLVQIGVELPVVLHQARGDPPRADR